MTSRYFTWREKNVVVRGGEASGDMLIIYQWGGVDVRINDNDIGA